MRIRYITNKKRIVTLMLAVFLLVVIGRGVFVEHGGGLDQNPLTAVSTNKNIELANSGFRPLTNGNYVSTFNKNDSFFIKSKNHFKYWLARIVYANTHNLQVMAIEVKDPQNKVSKYSPKVKASGGKIKVELGSSGRSFSPGMYTMQMEVLMGTQVYLVEQNFTLGVLSINTNKALYQTDEIAYLQIAVLTSEGHTVCNANLKLAITLPSGTTKTLSTDEGTIKSGKTCDVNNVTDKPDYFLYTTLPDAGTYDLVLQNVTNGNEITDSFVVESEPMFSIERVSATRINPFKSAYKVRINVKSKSNFNGAIVETLPNNFVIKSHNGNEVEVNDDVTKIRFDVSLRAGDTKQLEYVYQAPEWSPYIFLLGPLELHKQAQTWQKSGKAFFVESRQWTLASDASGDVSTVTSGVPRYTHRFTTEQIGGTNAHVLILENIYSSVSPDYKYQFITNGVRVMIDRKQGVGFEQLVSEIRSDPEYKKQQGANGNFIWKSYGLNATTTGSNILQTWDKINQPDGSTDFRRLSDTNEEGVAEVLTELWTVPTTTEQIQSIGPKVSVSMTQNRGIVLKNGVLEGTWRMLWSLAGIADITSNNTDIKDGEGNRLRKKAYADFRIDWTDFYDYLFDQAGADNPDFVFSEIGANNKAQLIAYENGTTSPNRIVDPAVAVYGASPGWTHSSVRNIFYSGKYFVLVYGSVDNGDAVIVAKTSLDGVTWNATSTIGLGLGVNPVFNAYMVNDAKLDIAYLADSSVIAVKTCTITATITCDSGSTFGDLIDRIAIARAPFDDTIYVVASDAGEVEVWSANTRGDAGTVTGWTDEVNGGESNVQQVVSIAPLYDSDAVLAFYVENAGGPNSDEIWCKKISDGGGNPTEFDVTDFNAGGELLMEGNPIRISDTDYRFLQRNTVGGGAIIEYSGDCSASWTNLGSIDSETDKTGSALAYDNIAGNLHAFGIDTGATPDSVDRWDNIGDVASWSTEYAVDTGETTARSNVVTQMHVTTGHASSTRTEPLVLPWAYLLEKGSVFDLKVGYELLSGTTTARKYIFATLDDTATSLASTSPRNGVATSTAITGVRKGERLIVGFQIDNESVIGTTTKPYRLQYDKNDSTWVDVATTTEIRWSLAKKGALHGRGGPLPIVASTKALVDSDCESGLTRLRGEFVAGTATSTTLALGPKTCMELGYMIETSGATAGQLYRLRLIDGHNNLAFDGNILDGEYAVYPTLTIETTQELGYSKEARGGFASITLDSAGITGIDTSVAIGTDGYPVIAYHDGSLRFAKCNDASCTSTTKRTLDSATADMGEYTSIAIGSDGYPVISYHDQTDGDLEFIKCNDASCATKIQRTLDTATADIGWFTSIAIGTDGFPVISYHDEADGDLEFIKCNDISCLTKTQRTLDTATADIGEYTSIAIGTDGYPVISYHDNTDGDLEFIKCNDASCSSTVQHTLDVATAHIGEYTSLAIGADGYPVISYHDLTGKDLEFIKCNDASCSRTTQRTLHDDGANVVGFFTSIAIGIDGFPVISYFDSFGGDLEFIKCNDPSCDTALNIQRTLDTATAEIGRHTFIAIGADGYPVVAYYDFTGKDLEFIKCNTISCAPSTDSLSARYNDLTPLSYYLDDSEYRNIASSSDKFFDFLTLATSTYGTFNFTRKNTNDTDDVRIEWRGLVTEALTTTLEVYNHNTSAWEAQMTTTPATSTAFTLYANITASQTNYYDASDIAFARVRTATTTQTGTLSRLVGGPYGGPSATSTLTQFQTHFIDWQFASTSQDAYIFLNDSGGNIASSTPRDGVATSTAITGVRKGERIAVGIQVTNNNNASSTRQYQLQYDKNDNTWIGVSTTTEIKWSLSQNASIAGRANGPPLPSPLVDDECAFNASYVSGEYTAGRATTTSITLGPSKCTDLVFVINTASTTINQMYRLRVFDATTNNALDTYGGNYAVYPTFTTETAQTIRYSKEVRGGFASTTLDSAGTTGLLQSIAIGTDGFPVISYYDATGKDLEFIKCNDASCASVTQRTLHDDGSNIVGEYTSIAIGTDGFPVISYHDATGKDLEFVKCNDPSCDTALNTQRTLHDDGSNIFGQYTSIAIGTDGFPVISYHDATGGDLEFIKCNDVSCSSTTQRTLHDDGSNVVGQYTSIAIGTDGYPVVSYYDVTGRDLEFIKCNDASCSSTTQRTLHDDGTNFVGADSSIIIGTDGYPVISYHDSTGKDLEFIKCNDPSCDPALNTQRTLHDDGSNTVGQTTSIAIGTDGYPVISYHDATGKDLEFIKCNDPSCDPALNTQRTLHDDGSNTVGQYTSIVIGADGYPIVSYYDASGFDLEFIKCNTISCAPSTDSLSAKNTNNIDLTTYFGDEEYDIVDASDNTYATTSFATSSAGMVFYKDHTNNTDDITIKWEGQISESLATTLEIYNLNSAVWEVLQTNSSPTVDSDFVLEGTISSSQSNYYDGADAVYGRLYTATSTTLATLKTDQISVTFGAGVSLTFVVTDDTFTNFVPGNAVFATATLSVDTTNSTGWNVVVKRDDTDTTMDYDSDATINILDQADWVAPGATTTSSATSKRISALDSNADVLAFRIMTASGTDKFISDVWWGSVDDYVDNVDTLWSGIPDTNQRVGDSSVSSGGAPVLNTAQFYLDVPNTQKSGAYSGGVTFSATVNP